MKRYLSIAVTIIISLVMTDRARPAGPATLPRDFQP